MLKNVQAYKKQKTKTKNAKKKKKKDESCCNTCLAAQHF